MTPLVVRVHRGRHGSITALQVDCPLHGLWSFAPGHPDSAASFAAAHAGCAEIASARIRGRRQPHRKSRRRACCS